jgi:hypothetical protein
MSQTGQNVSVRYKVQSAKGTPASGSGGKELPLVASGGLALAKAAIRSPEVRSDGMRTIPRHGSRSVGGEYMSVVRLAALDELLEAVFRGTWVPSFTITNTAMTSITTTTNTIVAAAGSWITQGLRVGDVITLTGHATAANNSKRLLVTALTASTITVPANSLTTDAVADTSFTVTVHKRLTQGVTKRYFTFEEYHADIDQSELFTDCMVSSVRLQLQPDNTAQAQFGLVGINGSALATGSSPQLTTPTAYDTANLIATDALIYKNGVAIAILTGFDILIDLAAQTVPVIGATTSPDVYPDNASVTGTISALRTDLQFLSDFDAETELAIAFLLREPEAAPEDFISVFLPVTKLMQAPSAALGNSGPMTSTMQFECGKKPTTSGFADTMVQINSSAA